MHCNGFKEHVRPLACNVGYWAHMPKSAQITVRVEEELLDRIDAIVARMRTPLLEPRRSDIVRACLLKGLAAYEAEAARSASGHAGPRKRR